MPQAIAAAVTAVADYAAAAATSTLVAAGMDISFTTALLVEGSISIGLQAGIYVGISAGVSALTAPSIPKPEAVALTKKQPIPTRQTGWGRARLGGAYMLYEGNRSNAWIVLALHDGQVDGFEQFYLHDDRVVLDGSGWANSRYQLDNNPTSGTYGQYVLVTDGQRYAPNHVQILTRTGAATETVYSQISSAVPSWGSTARGDGIASLAMLCNQGQAKYFSEDYPNGLPDPSVVTRLKKVWDPRDGSQSRTNPTTWLWSDNPVLALLDYLWADPHGPLIDYTSKLAPVISDISSEATYCDNAITLKAGGTEKRYRLGGVYDHQNHPADVIKSILSTMDGWMAQRGDGAIIIKAGRYDAPTVTLSPEYILSYTWSRYTPDEQAVNTLDVSFCSPLHNYSEVQTDSWTDDADIAARGIVRSQSMSLPWVQWNGQARRLAKRRMSQVGAQIRGTVKCNLYGLDILENRYFTLNIPDVACLTGLICEIDPAGKPELNLMDMTVTIPWIAADPNVDSWNPTLEEGAGVALVAKWSSETLSTPTIVSVVPTYAAAADGGGTRLVVTLTNSGRADQSYGIRWKDSSEVSYVEALFTGPFSTTGNIIITTGLVKNNATLDVSAELVTGSGIYSGWCSDTVVTTTSGTADQTALVATGHNSLVNTEFQQVVGNYPLGYMSAWVGNASPSPSVVDSVITAVGGQKAMKRVATFSASPAGKVIDCLESDNGQPARYLLPVTPGDNLMAMLAMASQGGGSSGWVEIGWCSASGTEMAEITGSVVSCNINGDTTDIATWPVSKLTATVPADGTYASPVRYAMIWGRFTCGTATSMTMWSARPFLAKVPAGQTAYPPYTPGPTDRAATYGAQAGTNLVDSGGSALTDSAIKNSAVSISAGGALSGAGGGAVTLGGLGAGSLATKNTTATADIDANAVTAALASAGTGAQCGVGYLNFTTGGGLPYNGDTLTIGSETYTFATTPAAATDIKIAATVALQHVEIANTVNNYSTTYGADAVGPALTTTSGAQFTLSGASAGKGVWFHLLASNTNTATITYSGSATASPVINISGGSGYPIHGTGALGAWVSANGVGVGSAATRMTTTGESVLVSGTVGTYYTPNTAVVEIMIYRSQGPAGAAPFSKCFVVSGDAIVRNNVISALDTGIAGYSGLVEYRVAFRYFNGSGSGQHCDCRVSDLSFLRIKR